MSRPNISIKLKPRAEVLIKKGHPWVFDQSIVKQNKEGEAGDIVIVFDQKKNKFLALGLYDPHSPIRVKILEKKPATLNVDFWIERIRLAILKRENLLKTDTNSYRLFYGENDGMPGFIIDVYNKVAVVKIYSAIWVPYFKDILEALNKLLDFDALVLRLSRNLQGQDYIPADWEDGRVIEGALGNEEIVFTEHGLQFSANVIKGHKTGYFLDHRHNRKKIGSLSKGKTVLDVFSYAGGFTVHALAGGAKKVVSLDISRQAQEMAKKNVALNNFENMHEIIVGDAFAEMQKLIQHKVKFDIVVIDPPSFAKKASEVAKAMQSYRSLVSIGAQIVEKNGMLMMASCSSRVIAENFYRLVEEELSKTRKWEIIAKTDHDEDHPIAFPEGAYLKSGYYRLY